MTIIKIVGVAVLGLIIAGILKDIKPSLSVFAGLATGLIILFSLLDEFTTLISEFKRISAIANLDGTLISTIIKIIGIGYLGEFIASITDDYGFPSIGKKILFGAKITIVLMALPIVGGIIESILSLIS